MPSVSVTAVAQRLTTAWTNRAETHERASANLARDSLLTAPTVIKRGRDYGRRRCAARTRRSCRAVRLDATRASSRRHEHRVGRNAGRLRDIVGGSGRKADPHRRRQLPRALHMAGESAEHHDPKLDHAGGTRKIDSELRVAAVASSLRRAISSTTDVK
jgi:hypothetical protein